MRRPSWNAVIALREPRYRSVWGAVFVSNLGIWLQITARALLVYRLTGSTGALGVIYLVSYGPQLFLAPLAGAVADRYDRRTTLVVGTAVLALANVAVGVLTQTHTATLLNLAALSFLCGCLLTVTQAASNALLPALVSEAALASAIGLQAMTNSVTRVFGPLLAGLLAPVTGLAWLFHLNALSLLPVILVWRRIEVPPPPPVETGTVRAIADGLRFTRRTPAIAVPVAMLAVLAGIGLVYQPLGVAYATATLAHGQRGTGTMYFALLQAAIGLGSIVGILAMTEVSRRRPAATLVSTGVAFSVALAGLGLTARVDVALVVAVALGATQFANSNLVLTLAQTHAPEEMRGRVMSLTMVAFVGVFPFASYGQGLLAQVIGTRATFVVCGGVCLVASLLVLRWRGAVRFPAEAVQAPEIEAPRRAAAVVQ